MRRGIIGSIQHSNASPIYQYTPIAKHLRIILFCILGLHSVLGIQNCEHGLVATSVDIITFNVKKILTASHFEFCNCFLNINNIC